MTYTTTIETPYPNVNLTIGPIKHTEKDAVRSIKNENDSFDKYRAHLSAMITYLKFDNPSFRRLDGGTWGPTIHIDISRIHDIGGNLLAIAFFVNGLLLNINKLPYAPLVFDGNTVNNLPLKNFVILPSDKISAWDCIESKKSKLWAAFLEYRV